MIEEEVKEVKKSKKEKWFLKVLKKEGVK
jgi:hypothetical protein